MCWISARRTTHTARILYRRQLVRFTAFIHLSVPYKYRSILFIFGQNETSFDLETFAIHNKTIHLNCNIFLINDDRCVAKEFVKHKPLLRPIIFMEISNWTVLCIHFCSVIFVPFWFVIFVPFFENSTHSVFLDSVERKVWKRKKFIQKLRDFVQSNWHYNFLEGNSTVNTHFVNFFRR